MKILILLSALIVSACTGSAPAPEKNLPGVVVHFSGHASPDYEHAFVDLNDDGIDDAIVLLRGMDWCGSGGCTMLVLKGESSGFTVMSRSTVIRAPVRISESRSHGWRDIIVYSDGAEKLMRFDGNGYPLNPLNPSMQTTATHEQAASAKTVLP